ncbi:condensation domain-containing protein [Nocardia arizonensis]|uniref:condensation domain-containing protein n=1 Tax=Nocardia arizonensis TaxID=1141647 RepID=UPI0006D2C902|nr:condensation domain-containing protein [Nocardia arizonensis]
MVDFGFIEDWEPDPGLLTSWTPSSQTSVAARSASVHPVLPSHQQQEYLRVAARSAHCGLRGSRLCLISFTIPGTPDLAVWERTFTRFLRRHDTFSSWFAEESDGSFVRRVFDASAIRLTRAADREFRDSDAIRAHVEYGTPGPLEWDCFGFGVVEHENSYTVYAVVDHLHTDGIGQALSCVDLITLFADEASDGATPPTPVEGHIAYCAREQAHNGRLTSSSPAVRAWLDLLRRNDGHVPGFPADLGVERDRPVRGAVVTIELISEDEALRFDETCRAAGGRFTGGMFAAAALAEAEVGGGDWHFGLTPVNTRATDGEAASIGWYSNLIPVAFPVDAGATFTSLVPRAQAAYDDGKELIDTSVHRALELATPEDGIRTERGWSARMLSYVDVRRIPGVEMFDLIDGGLYGNRSAATDVYNWINRFPDVTKLSVMFPDTPAAHAAIERYLSAMRAVFATVAARGEYAPRAGVLP